MDGNTKKDTSARLYVILARAAPVAVIFRRGPSKRVRIIKWHTDTDHREPGQWLLGRIYEKRCDLSPDGSLLVYFAAKYRAAAYSWTAISRPPYLTALSLWHKDDCWWGGGLFEDDRTLWLNHRPDEVELHPPSVPPHGIRVNPEPQACGVDYPIESRRWLRDGWLHVQECQSRFLEIRKGYVTEQEDVWHKPHRGLGLVLERRMRIHGYNQRRRYRVLHTTGAPAYVPENACWADWDQSGRLVFAARGRLFAVALENLPPPEATELVDLNPMRPEPIETPDWAKAW